MKKIIFLLLLFIAFLNSNLRETVRYENYLQNQLESYLTRVLPPKSFIVSVSVQISKNRKQEVAKESSDRINKQDSSEPVFSSSSNNDNNNVLPGLEFLEEDNQNAPQVFFKSSKTEEQEKITREYDYVDEIIIEAVDVQIVLDNQIPIETINTVRQVITDKFDANYEDKAIVNFITSNIENSEQLASEPEVLSDNAVENQNLIEEFNQLREELLASEDRLETFKDYLDNYGFIFYLLLGLIFLFLIFLFFLFFIWFLSRIFNRNNLAEGISNPITPNKPIEPLINQKINEEITRLEKDRKLEEEKRKLASEKEKQREKQEAEKLKKLEEAKRAEQEKKVEEARRDQEKRRAEEAKITEQEKKVEETDKQEYKRRNRMNQVSFVGEETEFIDFFLEDTLTGRKYVTNLSENEGLDLIHSFSNENIKRIFAELKGEVVLEEESPYLGLNEFETAQAKKNLFKKHLKGLEQYRKILSKQNSDVFGKLSLLKKEEINFLFSSLGVDAVADLSLVIDNEVLEPYLKSLNEKERQNLLKAINSNKQLSYDKLDDLRRQFSDKLDEISNNIFIKKSQKNDIMFNLLKTSSNKKELLDEIRKDNSDFYEKYANYQITFEDFLKEENTLKNKIIDNSENATLATAAQGLAEEQVDNLLELLPDNRASLIRGLIATKASEVSRNDVFEAQEKILEQYRNLKF